MYANETRTSADVSVPRLAGFSLFTYTAPRNFLLYRVHAKRPAPLSPPCARARASTTHTPCAHLSSPALSTDPQSTHTPGGRTMAAPMGPRGAGTIAMGRPHHSEATPPQVRPQRTAAAAEEDP